MASRAHFRGRCVFAGPLLLLIVVLAGCTVLPKRSHAVPSYALADTQGTTLGQLAATARRDAGGSASDAESALCMLDRGEDAWIARCALIDLAERSIDVQTFSWYSDSIGQLLAARLLAAADRGVRIRILLDDLYAAGRDFNIGLLDAYPNVEVRLYNPFRIRFFTRFGRPLEMLVSLDRLDHRMHNKTFVVDNQAAVVGGRNVADEYFGVNPTFDYRDFDLLALGPAAAQVSTSFDAYWSDARSYPVHDVAPREFNAEHLREGREKLNAAVSKHLATFPYPLPRSREEALRSLADTLRPAVRARTQMLYDDPRKGDFDTAQPSQIREVLALTPPTSEVLLMNPYFIPQKRFVDALVCHESRGVRVRILTNSLASTDVIAVHSGYAKRRKELLRSGVALYEVRPDAEGRGRYIAPARPKATLGLHGKVMILDRRRVFVGSMNLDPRSHRLNTEDGMLIDSPELARQVAEKLDFGTEPDNCWQLSMMNDDIAWSTRRNQKLETDRREPDASFWRKLKCQFLKLLPIEDEL